MSALVIHLLSVAVLALLVEFACRLGKFRPAVCHALWLVVLLKFVVPPVVSWPIDAELLGRLSWERIAAMPSPGPLPGESVAVVERAAGEVSGTLRPGEEFTVLIPHTTWEPLSWVVLLGGIWTGGGLLLALRTVREVRRARARLSKSLPVPDWMRARINAAAAVLRVAAPRAVVTQESGAVYVQLSARPVLMISAEALEYVAPEQWDAILTHELAHLKRRDHWVAWLMLAAGVVWWWNPCLWWVRNRIHLFSEMACDAWVVNVHPGARKQYAETMVRIMALLSRQDAPAPAMGLAAWSASSQERRLWMIMKAKGGYQVPWATTAGIAVLAALIAPAWLARSAEESVAPKSPEAQRAAWEAAMAPSEAFLELLKQPVDVEVENWFLYDLAELLKAKYDLNIVVDTRAVAPQPKEKGSFSGVLYAEGAEPVEEKPLVIPELVAPYVSDGFIPYFKIIDAPLGEILKAIARPLGLQTQYRGNAVWLSTPELLAEDQSIPLPEFDSENETLVKLMDSKMQMEFEDIHLSDLFGFIEDVYEVEFVIDPRAVRPKASPGETVPADADTIVTDGIVVNVNLEGSLGDALYIITRQLNLTYAVNEVEGKCEVYISSPALINGPRA